MGRSLDARFLPLETLDLWSERFVLLSGMLGRLSSLSPLVSAGLVVLMSAAASAQPPPWTPSGAKDFSYGSTVGQAGGSGTGWKPENKLFYTPDMRWWAVLGCASPSCGTQSGSEGVYLYELVNHAWVQRLQLPGADAWQKADTIFDAASSALYLSLRDNYSSSSNPRASYLYELSYHGAGSWTLTSGPTTITTSSLETLSVALDSAGRLWATWRQNKAMKIAYTQPGGTTFTVSTLSQTAATGDDISAVTAFGTLETGGKIGVVWSDQNASSGNGLRFWFAWRNDSDPIGTWNREVAFGAGVGGCPTQTSNLCADDHINLKADGDDVYAVVKTSLNDPGNASPTDPLVELLHRDATGQWNDTTVSTVAVNGSRPILLLEPDTDSLYVFSEKNYQGIYLWQSSLSSPSFGAAPATWIVSGTSSIIDATSTRQVVTSSSGAVVEASRSGAYWHNELLPGS